MYRQDKRLVPKLKGFILESIDGVAVCTTYSKATRRKRLQTNTSNRTS